MNAPDPIGRDELIDILKAVEHELILKEQYTLVEDIRDAQNSNINPTSELFYDSRIVLKNCLHIAHKFEAEMVTLIKKTVDRIDGAVKEGTWTPRWWHWW